jgi:hypothetical protein
MTGAVVLSFQNPASPGHRIGSVAAIPMSTEVCVGDVAVLPMICSRGGAELLRQLFANATIAASRGGFCSDFINSTPAPHRTAIALNYKEPEIAVAGARGKRRFALPRYLRYLWL